MIVLRWSCCNVAFRFEAVWKYGRIRGYSRPSLWFAFFIFSSKRSDEIEGAPDPPFFILSPSVSFSPLFLFLTLSEYSTECGRKSKGAKVRRRGREILTRISPARSRREMRRKRERESKRETRKKGERGRPKKRALVLSLPHAARVANPSLSTIYQ